MATARLIPSTYAVSSTSYLSVSDASNMYANTDSTNYATITNTNASTSSRYLYLRGFNFGSLPQDAVIDSFVVKIKAMESGLSTSTSYAPRLANGTSALSNTTASENFGTSAKTITIPTGALTWQQIFNYGSDFTILVYVRRNNKNTTGYLYCYGAEIEVTYHVPTPQTEDKIMVKQNGAWAEGTPKVKVNGTWADVSKVFKKVGGIWVEQGDKSAMFSPNAQYKYKPYDAEIEYLESTGTQYIDTGIKPSKTLPFSCVFYNTNTAGASPGYGNIFGSRKSSGSNEYQLSLFSSGTISVGTRNTNKGFNTAAVHTVSFDGNNSVTIDGNTSTITTSSIDQSQVGNIILFGISQAGTPTQLQAGRIYSCSFGNVLDLIPVRVGNVGYMFDKISQTLFGNAGTGSFTLGNDI